jgi:hypothetical protein
LTRHRGVPGQVDVAGSGSSDYGARELRNLQATSTGTACALPRTTFGLGSTSRLKGLLGQLGSPHPDLETTEHASPGRSAALGRVEVTRRLGERSSPGP